MAIKNLMMDIVTNAVNELIKNDRSILISVTNKDDIIAYVLNRVQPKYITSERGILHGTLQTKYEVQERMDILKLIYEAVSEIKDRRTSKMITKEEAEPSETCLPHIIGTVLEETTLSIIPEVQVTLFFKDAITNMVYDEWENPYKSHKATMGYYHFWPRYRKSEMGDKPSFQLRFHHPKFNDTSIDVDVEILTSHSDLGKSHVVPIVLMTAKEGVNLDFLYEE